MADLAFGTQGILILRSEQLVRARRTLGRTRRTRFGTSWAFPLCQERAAYPAISVWIGRQRLVCELFLARFAHHSLTEASTGSAKDLNAFRRACACKRALVAENRLRCC